MRLWRLIVVRADAADFLQPRAVSWGFVIVLLFEDMLLFQAVVIAALGIAALGMSGFWRAGLRDYAIALLRC